MTAASILAMPKLVAAPIGATKAAAPGAENAGAKFSDMVAAEAPDDAPAAAPASANPVKDAANVTAQPISAPQPLLTPRQVAKTTATEGSAEATAPLAVAAPMLLAAGDVPEVDPADAESAATQAPGHAAADSPADQSAAFLALLVAPPVTPQAALHAATNAALVSSAIAGLDTPQELAPAADADAVSTDAEVDAAARQAAAAQALAAALPASKALLRPLDAAPSKEAPANASTGQSSESSETAPSSDAPDAEALTSSAAGAAAAQGGAPAASSTSPQAVGFQTPTAETPLDSAAPTGPAAGAPASATANAAPPAPVVVTNGSNLSRVTVETTVHIAAQITKKLEGRSTRFEMAMTPEGLGRVDISLDIDSGGKLTARLAFDNPLAATEMRGKADELRRELQGAGFTLAQDSLEFSQRQSSPDGGFDRRQGRAFAGASRINADADLTQPSPAAWVSLSLTPRGVDMKV